MKRNFDFIKKILEMKEDSQTEFLHIKHADVESLFGVSSLEFRIHFFLLVEHGLFKGGASGNGYHIDSLTWDGYEFLDNSRDSAVWNADKNAAGNLSFGVFQSVLVNLAAPINAAHRAIIAIIQNRKTMIALITPCKNTFARTSSGSAKQSDSFRFV